MNKIFAVITVAAFVSGCSSMQHVSKMTPAELHHHVDAGATHLASLLRAARGVRGGLAGLHGLYRRCGPGTSTSRPGSTGPNPWP